MAIIDDVIREEYPNANKLIHHEETSTALIIDEDLDPIECEFHNDRCVEIKTENYTFISLSIENLHALINMIEQTEIHCKKKYGSK